MSLHVRQNPSIEAQNWSISLTGLFPAFLLHYLGEWVPFRTMHRYRTAAPRLIRALICPLPRLAVPLWLYHSGLEICWMSWSWMSVVIKLLHNKCKVPSSSPDWLSLFICLPHLSNKLPSIMFSPPPPFPLQYKFAHARWWHWAMQ